MASKADERDAYSPPPHPPQLLNFDQVRHLAIHGWLPLPLSPDLNLDIDTLFTEGRTFFALPRSSKLTRYPPTHGTECGYYTVPDEKQYVTFRHAAHERPTTALLTLARRIWTASADILHRILVDLARAGHLELSIWDELVAPALTMPADGTHLDTAISLMRLFEYKPGAGTAAEHVDVGLLTLCVGSEAGLEVWDREREVWTGVDGPTVLVGDFARVLLRGRVRTGKHRVVATEGGRMSVVFALRPGLGGSLDLRRFGGKEVVDTREIFLKVKGPKFNVNAVREVRERQMQEQERRMLEWKEKREEGVLEMKDEARYSDAD